MSGLSDLHGPGSPIDDLMSERSGGMGSRQMVLGSIFTYAIKSGSSAACSRVNFKIHITLLSIC